MKKLLFPILIFLSACMTYANTNIADIIKNMPKEFLPYINDNMRAELVNSIKNGDTINISSMLEETIAIDSISADFIRMRATKTTTIQLRLLDVSDSTTIICMVKTFEVPICESKISFFSTSWSLLSEDYGLPTFNDNTTTLDSLTFKPEDMNEDKYKEIRMCIEPVVTHADISSADKTITFGLGIPPIVTSEEKRDIKRILRQKTFKWEGGIFKKC